MVVRLGLIATLLPLATIAFDEKDQSSACTSGKHGEEGSCGAIGASALLQSRKQTNLAHVTTSDELDDGSVSAEASSMLKAAILESARSGARIAAGQNTSATIHLLQRKAKLYAAHQMLMNRTMRRVNASYGPSNSELDNMLRHFEDNQATSMDMCPAKLLQAKHQMNALVTHIQELSAEISNIERSVVSVTQDLTVTYTEIQHSREWEHTELMKCKQKQEEDYKVYWVLKSELFEMHQIANPSFKPQYEFSFDPQIGPSTHTYQSTTTSGVHPGGGGSGGPGSGPSGGHGYSTGYSTGGSGGHGYSTGYSTGGSGGHGYSTGGWTTTTGGTTTTSSGYSGGGGGGGGAYGGSYGVSSTTTGSGYGSSAGGYGGSGGGYSGSHGASYGHGSSTTTGHGYTATTGHSSSAGTYGYGGSGAGYSTSSSNGGYGSSSGGYTVGAPPVYSDGYGPPPQHPYLIQQSEKVVQAPFSFPRDDELRGSAQGASQLVQNTKQAVVELTQCMSSNYGSDAASLLQTKQEPGPIADGGGFRPTDAPTEAPEPPPIADNTGFRPTDAPTKAPEPPPIADNTGFRPRPTEAPIPEPAPTEGPVSSTPIVMDNFGWGQTSSSSGYPGPYSSSTSYGSTGGSGSSSGYGSAYTSTSGYGSTGGYGSYSSTAGYGPSTSTTSGYGSYTSSGYGPSMSSGYGSSTASGSGYGPYSSGSGYGASTSSGYGQYHASSQASSHNSAKTYTAHSSSKTHVYGVPSSSSGVAASSGGPGFGTSSGYGASSSGYGASSSGYGASSGYGTSSGYGASSSGGPSVTCIQQQQNVQHLYIKAYMEITRLVAEYEKLIHGHNCEDWVYEKEGQAEKALKQKQEHLMTTVHSWEERLHALKMRFQEARTVEVTMREHLTELMTRCQHMGATMSSLDDVRAAIAAMGVCPGLGPLNFHIPMWTHVWMEGNFDTYHKTDEQIDMELNNLCASSHPQTQMPNGEIRNYRAAETSEIMLHTLDGVPEYNTAGLPLMGTCPNCEGVEDESDGPQHASHHARQCWYPNSYLSQQGARMDCQQGRKAVLCVEEYTYNHVEIAGHAPQPQYDGR